MCGGSSFPGLRRKLVLAFVTPFTWVLLVLACGGGFLFLDGTGWVNLEWWPQEEIKLLTGDSTEGFWESGETRRSDKHTFSF